MNDRNDQLKADPLPWLLEPDEENPGIRYFALRDLLDSPSDDPELVAAVRAALLFAGYALARFDFGGRNDSIVLGFMSQRMFPGALFILAFLLLTFYFWNLQVLQHSTVHIFFYEAVE